MLFSNSSLFILNIIPSSSTSFEVEQFPILFKILFIASSLLVGVIPQIQSPANLYSNLVKNSSKFLYLNFSK